MKMKQWIFFKLEKNTSTGWRISNISFFYLICHYFWTNFCRLPVLLINQKNMTWVYFSILVRYDKFNYENPSIESLIDRIMLNPEKFAQDTPLKGIRSDYFYTIKKEWFNEVTIDNNGAYLNSRSNKRVSAVGSFINGELQNVKIVHQSNDGTYFYNSRNARNYEVVSVNAKKVYTIERYYRQRKKT